MSDYLSQDDAIAQLAAQQSPEPDALVAQETPAPEPAAAPEVVETPSEPATTGDDGEAPAEPVGVAAPEAPPEPVKPAVEPPRFWSADAKARFSQLPPDLQSVILEEGKQGDRSVEEKQHAAAEARKAADAEAAKLGDIAKRFFFFYSYS